MRKNLKSRKWRGGPVEYTPKFQKGDRVRISSEGVHMLIAPEGTSGTVTHCGLVVQVLIDGGTETGSHWPDYWDAVTE